MSASVAAIFAKTLSTVVLSTPVTSTNKFLTPPLILVYSEFMTGGNDIEFPLESIKTGYMDPSNSSLNFLPDSVFSNTSLNVNEEEQSSGVKLMLPGLVV